MDARTHRQTYAATASLVVVVVCVARSLLTPSARPSPCRDGDGGGGGSSLIGEKGQTDGVGSAVGPVGMESLLGPNRNRLKFVTGNVAHRL